MAQRTTTSLQKLPDAPLNRKKNSIFTPLRDTFFIFLRLTPPAQRHSLPSGKHKGAAMLRILVVGGLWRMGR
jgi:hypothetical protein